MISARTQEEDKVHALDAGADNIVIDVADGGRTMISVMDNGKGMTADDLKIAITRHATSKLPDDDLLNINFMGFRGEALPSIASVADMTIDTFRAGDENGWQIDANTGEIGRVRGIRGRVFVLKICLVRRPRG